MLLVLLFPTSVKFTELISLHFSPHLTKDYSKNYNRSKILTGFLITKSSSTIDLLTLIPRKLSHYFFTPLSNFTMWPEILHRFKVSQHCKVKL